MKLDKIISITGRPGLFEMITQTRTSIVAVSLVDGKRISSNISQQISVLSEIQIYGLHGEVPLHEIFDMILTYEKGQPTRVKAKAAATDLEAYFFEIFKDYDEDRVYPSDIKKMIQWYNILLGKKMLEFPKKTEALEEVDSETKTNPTAASETSEETPSEE